MGKSLNFVLWVVEKITDRGILRRFSNHNKLVSRVVIYLGGFSYYSPTPHPSPSFFSFFLSIFGNTKVGLFSKNVWTATAGDFQSCSGSNPTCKENTPQKEVINCFTLCLPIFFVLQTVYLPTRSWISARKLDIM